VQLYLSFLDHAVASTADALRHWKTEERKTDEKREPFRISLSLQQTHLAIEKLLKHSVALVDSHLLLEQPNSRLLRDLQKEMISQGLPSIFASRRYLASSNVEQAWAVVQEVISPRIAPATASSFEAALKGLTALRNQSQHGVVYVDTGEALGTVERALARLPEVAAALCPEFLERLEQGHPHQYAELRALEAAVDAAWWTVRELLRKGRRISVPVSVHVTIRPNVPTVQLSITRASQGTGYGFTPKAGESSISLFAEVEAGQATGLFGRVITPEDASEREEARRQVVRRKLSLTPTPPPILQPTERPIPAVGGLLPSLDFSGLEALGGLRAVLQDSFARSYEQERNYIERYGLPPLEDGGIRLDGASAWITVPASNRSTSHVTGDVIVRDCVISLSRRRPRGRLSALLFPRKSAEREEPIAITGKVWLTSELVVKEDSLDSLPMGTVIRFLRGDVRLSLPASSKQ
jgi:hypothetical protein